MTDIAGVVLGAGAGTRLAPLTTLKPKALCPVDNRALVDWAIDRLTPYCSQVAVNIHHHEQQMVQHLEGRGVHLSIERPVALGTAGALGRLRDWIDGRPVLLTNADAWEPDSAALAALLRAWDGKRVFLRCVASPSIGDFGGLTYVGTALLPWWSVEELRPQPAGLYEVSWKRLHEAGRLELVTLDEVGPVDCGSPATYLGANLRASGGVSVVAPDAEVHGEVVRSVVWPGSRVERGERLEDAIRAQQFTIQVPRPRGE